MFWITINRAYLLHSSTSKADPPELVIESYRDVQRAKTDEQRLRNEAEAYRNDIIPKARGEAEKIQEAEAYKQGGCESSR